MAAVQARGFNQANTAEYHLQDEKTMARAQTDRPTALGPGPSSRQPAACSCAAGTAVGQLTVHLMRVDLPEGTLRRLQFSTAGLLPRRPPSSTGRPSAEGAMSGLTSCRATGLGPGAGSRAAPWRLPVPALAAAAPSVEMVADVGLMFPPRRSSTRPGPANVGTAARVVRTAGRRADGRCAAGRAHSGRCGVAARLRPPPLPQAAGARPLFVGRSANGARPLADTNISMPSLLS